MHLCKYLRCTLDQLDQIQGFVTVCLIKVLTAEVGSQPSPDVDGFEKD